MDSLRGRPLVWVSGSAGAGKTTLVASYFASRKEKAPIWYRIDAGDNDPATFFLYLTQAAQAVRPAFDGPAFTVEYQANLELFARKYFRRLYARLKSSHALVLDDYQEAAPDSPMSEIVRVAAEEAPPGTTIFVISRSEPTAAFARLGVAGDMGRVGWEDLRLNDEEVRALSELRAAEPAAGEGRRGPGPLSPATLRELHRATDGWVAGLVLVLERMHAGAAEAPPGTVVGREQVFDYFAGEVLHRAASPVRSFLLGTALFDKFSAGMAAALTGHPDAAQLLRELVRRNFFTSEHPGVEPRYRYHPLFREFLLAELRRSCPQEEVDALRRRAAEFAVQSGNIEDAVQQWTDAGAWDAMAAHLVAAAPDLLAQGRIQTLAGWIERIPAETRGRDPWLIYWHGAAILPGDPFAGYDLFERAYRRFSDVDDVRGRYLSWTGIANGLFFRNDDMAPAREWIEELGRLRAQHPQWPAPDIGARVTIAALSILTMGDPQHPALPKWLAQAEQLFQHVPLDSVRCVIGAHLGIYYSFWGEIGKLAATAAQLRPLADAPGVGYVMRLFAYAILVLHAWQAGDEREVMRTIERGLELIEESGVYITAQWLVGAAIVASHCHNRLDLTEQLVERYRKALHPRRRTGIGYHHYLVGWLALSRGQPDVAKVHFESAIELLTQTQSLFFLAQARSGLLQAYGELDDFARAQEQLQVMRRDSAAMQNRLFLEFQCNYLDAYLCDRQGNREAALAALRIGFGAAGRNNWIAQSSWCRAVMTRLCRLALENKIEPEYVRRLIRTYRLRPPEGSEPLEQWPYGARIYTLGRFAVFRDGLPVIFEGRTHKKPLDLVKALIALGGTDVAEQRLCDALWPGAEGDAARASLKMALHRLRSIVGHETIIVRESKLSLDSDSCWADVWAFERLANRLIEGGDALPAVERADIGERMFALYRGPFLGDEEGGFALLVRERLRGKWVRAIAALAGQLQREGRLDEALVWYERGLGVEPLSEPFYQGQMRACLSLRRAAEGLAAYERARKILASQLQVSPSPDTETLARALRGLAS
jgi:ATP/maltotriose-dependent transcriptional regulator MalT/DNA-binding SARP family transcriptional activator